ncbi:DNA-binding transcriptional LysR family regulator [Crossiella equi]|uniref:DNA-binding transcriptional LysR family regulator n=1 Tax=Crossiella equi TaxID=130796 RepID=A0ABS5AGU4_9PSEU|nr:LysR substrate-binding domain-containing protein [Crossiella equi]MBP2475796.1 DNA-binding transcriptional LysR family regulator [Crossiella equi]
MRDLRYFVAVAEELSFSRAADRLHVSQPALSKQIRLLERSLRSALLRRDRRTVALTAAGSALLPRAQRLLADWGEALGEVGRASAGERMVLSVGVHTNLAPGLFERVSQRFGELLPGWRIGVHRSDWDDPSAGVRDGTVDVALVWLPVADQDRYAYRVLLAEPRWVALPADHHLAERPEVPFTDLLGEPFVALPEAAGPQRDFWLALDARRDRPVPVAATAANLAQVFAAVAAGHGVALVSGSSSESSTDEDVVFRPVPGIRPARLAALWRLGEQRGAVNTFVRACREATE